MSTRHPIQRAAARAFLLGCLIATSACAAAEDEDLDTGAGALAEAPGGFVPGIERQRAGRGEGSVNDVQQRSVHFGNAHALALLSSAAYATGSTPASLAELGVDGVTSLTTFDNHCTGGYAIYVSSPTVAVLAFRGTQTDSDLDMDTNRDDAFHVYPFARDGEDGAVHQGFLRQFESLWRTDATCGIAEGIGTLLAARHATGRPSPPLYFTGHSLGGALATLALAQTFVEGASAIAVAGLYTFGAPKVGNPVFAEVLGDHVQAKQTPVFRFVHRNDIVPTQPRPLTTMLHEDWNHVKPHGTGEHTFQVWFDGNGARVGTLALFLGFSIADHSLNGYIDDIAINARARNELR